MTKHQKIKICQNLYKRETENYKHKQHIYIMISVIYIILFLFVLVQSNISGDKNIFMFGLCFAGFCGCIIEIILNHKHHMFIRDCINDHDFVITEHDGKTQLVIPGTNIVLSDE